MLEIIKEAGTILKDLPELAVWILIGILFYKVFIIGSSLAFAKYCVNKLHDFLTKPKEVIRKVDVSDRFICHDGTFNRFINLLDKVKAHSEWLNQNLVSKYFHGRDVAWLEKAVERQILEDQKTDQV